jgi:MFS family permease
MNALVLRSAIVAALGGLLFGFDTAVISGTTQQLTQVYQLSPGGLGFTVATALLGTILGALIAGKPVDRYGRKKVLFAIGILYFIGALGSAFVTNLALFQIFRFLGGIGVGVASVVAPIYTAEIAPPALRGRLVGLVQFNIVLGILLAYLSNFVIGSLLPAEVAWRWMFAVMAVPAAVFFLLLFTVPETPRWLFQVGRRDEAVTVVERTTKSREEADFEIREIEEGIAAQHGQRQVAFFKRQNRKVILLAFAIAAFNQLSGSTRSSTTPPTSSGRRARGERRRPGERHHRPRQPDRHDGRADRHRQDRAAQAHADRLDRLPRQPGRARGGVLRVRGAVLRLLQRPRAGRARGVHRRARVRPGLGDLGVHLRDLPQPHPRPRPVAGQPHALGVRRRGLVDLPGDRRGAGAAAWRSCCSSSAWSGQLLWVLKVMPETRGVPLEEMERNLGIELSEEDISGAQSGPRAH